MILIDSDVLIQYFKKDKLTLSQLTDIGLEEILVPDVVVAELY